MDKNLEFNVNVHADRKIAIELPKDFPCVPVTVIVKKAKKGKAKSGKKSVRASTADDEFKLNVSKPKIRTFGDLLKSEFVGMWADRTDIVDRVEYAQKLREEAWGLRKRK